MLRFLIATAAIFAASPPAWAQRDAASGLDQVPHDAFAFATVNFAQLWEHPSLKPVRDFISVSPGVEDPFARLLGVAPADIERLTMFATHPEAINESLVVVLTTRRPYPRSELLKNLGVTWRGPVQAKRNGNVLLLERGPFSAVVLADDRTLFYLVGERFGQRDDNRALVTIGKLLARSQKGPLSAALVQAPNHAVCVGLDVGQLADAMRGGHPSAIAPLVKARTAVFTADLAPTGLKAQLALHFPDEASAKQAVPALEKLIESLAADIDREGKSEAGRGEAGAAFTIFFRWLSWTLSTVTVKAEGNAVVATLNAPVDEVIVKVMAKLPKSIEASAAAVRASNNLKQIALAMHSYHDVTGRFPGNVLAPNGTPLLSWRVQLLPFLEQGPLAQQVRMNESWDSPTNKALLDRMPDVFALPGRSAPRGETYFRTFALPRGAAFQLRPFHSDGDPWGTRITQITDGTSNTFMFVEAGESVPWTKPNDLPYDGKLPLPKLGPTESDRFWVAYCDGSVRQVPKKDNEQNIRAMITTSGGEIVNWDR